jgi:hypothetical protein
MAQYTTVTRTSWGQRLANSIGGLVGGIALIVISLGMLWWNEGRAVNTARGLSEGAGAVVSADAARVDPAYNGQLVHVSGQAESRDVLRDSLLRVEQVAVALIREVEMYQWQEDQRTETRTRAGGGEERVTTYSYRPVWSSRHIDSSRFNQAGTHRNPSQFPIPAETWRAANVSLGAYRLSPGLIAQIGHGAPVALGPDNIAGLPERLRERARHDQPNQLYIGDPMMPEVGDLRIRVLAVGDQPVSIMARQVDNTFEPYATSHGTTISRLMAGTLSAGAMVEQMERENSLMTWGLRGLGLVMVITGFGLVLKPIRLVFDVLPLLGSIAGAGLGLVSLVLGSVLALLTIALAWMAYRPLLSVVLIAVCAGLVFLVRQRRSAPEPSASAPAAAGSES